jgi:hypothetical protein
VDLGRCWSAQWLLKVGDEFEWSTPLGQSFQRLGGFLRIIHSSRGGHPFELPKARQAGSTKGGAGNWFGAFSIQTFVDQNA